jgi:2-oxoglutarate ferredoxin oxidoreductase subunit beta
MYRALAAIGRPPHEIAFVSGIGCSSRIPGYTTAYGFNSVHGRALPIAQGHQAANPDLLVLVAGGDGDGFSIGGGHVPHAIRRNMDLTYIVMDNQIYGLTKGQLSPTSPKGSRPSPRPTGASSAGQPAAIRAGLRRWLRGAEHARRHAGLAKVIEEAIRYPGLLVRQRAVAVRDLRRGAGTGTSSWPNSWRPITPQRPRSSSARWCGSRRSTGANSTNVATSSLATCP